MIRAQHAVDWACATSEEFSAGYQSQRLCLARGFLKHLRLSLQDTEIPAFNIIASGRRHTPYIFATGEISHLLEATKHLRPMTSLRPHTYRVLFGLLACTGIRPSEATKLLISDVKLDEAPPRLLIRQTKFGKSRWVPLHPTAAAELHSYKQLRLEMHNNRLSDVFFLSGCGQRLNYTSLQVTFHRLVKKIGITSNSSQRQPSLYTFRHTFAVQRLKTWYESGADPRALSPTLSVYLGHVDLAASYWYLTATPELLSTAAQRFETYAMQGDAE